MNERNAVKPRYKEHGRIITRQARRIEMKKKISKSVSSALTMPEQKRTVSSLAVYLLLADRDAWFGNCWSRWPLSQSRQWRMHLVRIRNEAGTRMRHRLYTKVLSSQSYPRRFLSAYPYIPCRRHCSCRIRSQPTDARLR